MGEWNGLFFNYYLVNVYLFGGLRRYEVYKVNFIYDSDRVYMVMGCFDVME